MWIRLSGYLVTNINFPDTPKRPLNALFFGLGANFLVSVPFGFKKFLFHFFIFCSFCPPWGWRPTTIWPPGGQYEQTKHTEGSNRVLTTFDRAISKDIAQGSLRKFFAEVTFCPLLTQVVRGSAEFA